MGLLQKAADKTGSDPEKSKRGAAGSGPKNTEEAISNFHNTHLSFQGIVLEIPPEIRGETQEAFCEKVSRMVSAFGLVFPLSPGNALVLIPDELDRELLAHRLSKSLHTQVLSCFQANDPGRALELLAPYR
jgi:hypothetical protein